MSDDPLRLGDQECARLLTVLRELRQQCPWDREQSIATLGKHLVEEAYEALDAIERDDTHAIIEELGDLISQVLSAAVIAEEQRRFRVAQLFQSAADKLVRRHPHVYADGAATFYRAEPDFVLQGGARFENGTQKNCPYAAVPNEYRLPNYKGTMSAARGTDPDSWTTEFSIQVRDNAEWNGPGGGDPNGYAVFARVVDGWEIVEEIVSRPHQQTKNGIKWLKTPVVISKMQLMVCPDGVDFLGWNWASK